MALLAYTAVDRLVKCMGPNQPWALFLTENLNDLAEKQPFDVIMLDQRIPHEAYSWGVCEYESEDGCDGFREGV